MAIIGNGNGRTITTKEASVKTASVEVKALTISGKQVTLAVFRQLKEEPLVTSDGQLRGVPWGTVNYHWDKCQEGGDHLHVVWQKDDQLRRSLVPLARPDSGERGAIHAAELNIIPVAMRILIRRRITGETLNVTLRSKGAYSNTVYHAVLDCDGIGVKISRDHNGFMYGTFDALMKSNELTDYERDNLQNVLDNLEDGICSAHVNDDFARLVNELRHQEDQQWVKDEEWSKRYRELASLDQLFIAV